MKFSDINAIVRIIAAELRDKYSDDIKIIMRDKYKLKDSEACDKVPDEVLVLKWNVAAEIYHRRPHNNSIPCLANICEELKNLVERSDRIRNRCYDILKRIFIETIYYYQKEAAPIRGSDDCLWSLRSTATGNKYHLPLLMEVARQYSPLMYDCLYYIDALRKNYDKDLMRQTLQGMRRNAMNILVFFDQNKRSIAPDKYYNLTPNVDVRSSLFDLLEIDEDAQVFMDFLADFFLHCKQVVDALFPQGDFSFAHPLPPLVLYLVNKLSTEKLVNFLMTALRGFTGEEIFCEMFLDRYYVLESPIFVVPLTPHLTLAQFMLCTFYHEGAMEDDVTGPVMLHFSKRYEKIEYDSEIVEALNLCLAMYAKASQFAGERERIGKILKLKQFWTEKLKIFYESLSQASRDRIFKHVIKQQIDGYGADRVIGWSLNTINSKSSTSVTHCNNRFMQTESWKRYFDMRIEKKPLMDRFHDSHSEQELKELCLFNENYSMERLTSYKQLFEGDKCSHCAICFQERQHFYVPPCCSYKYCDHCVSEYIKSKIGAPPHWERIVPCPNCRTPWKEKKALLEDAKWVTKLVHDEVDSFFLALMHLHSPVHKLPYHPYIVKFFLDRGIHLQTPEKQVMTNMRYFPQKKTFSPIVKFYDTYRDLVLEPLFKADMPIRLLTPRDGRLEDFYVQKKSHHYAHKKITVGDLYDYLPKATVIDDPKKKFVVGLDSEKVFFYRPHITIKCANRDVKKKIWYHKGSSTEHDMRHSVHEDLLPFCEFKLEHLQNDNDMIASGVNFCFTWWLRKFMEKEEVFPIIVSSTPLDEQRVWTVSDNTNGFSEGRFDFLKKLTEDLDDDAFPRIGSVWELQEESGSKKRKRDEDEVLYLCEKVSFHEHRLTVTLVPMLFLPSDPSDRTCVRANILYNSKYNGLIYDRINAYCKVTDAGWKMETECIQSNTKKDRDKRWQTPAVAKSKQRWTRRKGKEDFVCYHKNKPHAKVGRVHKLVDINPCKLYAIKGDQFVLSLIHKKKYCLYNNRCTNNEQIYEHRDHEILDLCCDDGTPLVVDEPSDHDQIMHIFNHDNGQVEMGHYERKLHGAHMSSELWENKCPIIRDYVPVSEDLANSIL